LTPMLVCCAWLENCNPENNKAKRIRFFIIGFFVDINVYAAKTQIQVKGLLYRRVNSC
jgi:hypothetical protein